MLEFHPQKPRPVRLLFHRMRRWVPLIEIADQADGLSLRRVADEVHGPQVLLGAIAIQTHRSEATVSPKDFGESRTRSGEVVRIELPGCDTVRSSRALAGCASARRF